MVSTAAFLNVIVVDCVASSAWDRAGAVVILAACSNSSAKPKLPTREETAWLCMWAVFSRPRESSTFRGIRCTRGRAHMG